MEYTDFLEFVKAAKERRLKRCAIWISADSTEQCYTIVVETLLCNVLEFNTGLSCWGPHGTYVTIPSELKSRLYEFGAALAKHLGSDGTKAYFKWVKEHSRTWERLCEEAEGDSNQELTVEVQDELNWYWAKKDS